MASVIGWNAAYGAYPLIDYQRAVRQRAAPSLSQPGAYGAYPLIDYQHIRYLAMLAREGALGSFVEGKAVIDALTPAIQAWAGCKP